MKHTALVIMCAVLLAGCTAGKCVQPGATGTAAGRPVAVEPSADTGSEARPEFTLGVGDKLVVNVWRNPELSRTVQVDPAGNISLPLVGDIPCAGQTVGQLRQSITEELRKVLLNPQVDISLAEMKSRVIYVLGEVRTPGSYGLDRPTLPWEAVSKAGGFTVDANTKNVLLVRVQNKQAQVTVHSLDHLLSGASPVDQSYVREGDIVYVPPSRIADIERFMVRLNNILSPLVTIERGIILGDEAKAVLEGDNHTTDPRRTIVVP